MKEGVKVWKECCEEFSDSDGSGSGSVLILDLVVHKERREGTYSMIKLRQRSLIK